MAKTSPEREALINGLNEDLAREYQAIIAYVVYSQAMKGPEYMTIAKELEVHAARNWRTPSRSRNTSPISAAITWSSPNR